MQEELVTDENGTPVELIYRNVNSEFEKHFYRKEEVVGKKGSEIFPESMAEFLHFTKIALTENRAITFPYYFKAIDTFYDVILKGTNQGNMIDVFCLNSTKLHKAQQKLSATNNKLAMALDVANIVPWKWDLLSKTILCDINKPIELSTNGKDVEEEQLAVPDSQYFAKIFKEDRQRVEKAYPKDKQQNIFGRFVKLNSFAQGTGLGLSICKTLMDHMGGKIGVESEKGQGATFGFTLPYRPAMDMDKTKKQEDVQPIVVEKGKLTILIAEDNVSNYKLFESILKFDYHLIHAWDGWLHAQAY